MCIMYARSDMRKGFALLVTLSVLSIVIALSVVTVEYFDRARRSGTEIEALVQAETYFSDIKRILMSLKNKKEIYAVLYQSGIPLTTKEGDLSAQMACHPLRSGIGLYWLSRHASEHYPKLHEIAEKVFESLSEKYEIKDPSLLEEMIVQGVENSLKNKKKEAFTWQHFESILRRYQFQSDDKSVLYIPWRQIFTLSPLPKKGKYAILGDYLNAEAIALLFDMDLESVRENWHKSEGAFRGFLLAYAIPFDKKLFTEKIAGGSECSVTFLYENEYYAFSFIDNDGEVYGFDFKGKQN